MSRWRSIQQRATPLALCFLLLICLFYQGYRYPFKINSAVTSPTYSDTPTWLQLGKWGLIAVTGIVLAALVASNVRSALAGGSRIRFVALALEAAIIVLALVRIALGAASVDPWLMLIGAGIAALVTLTGDAAETASDWIGRIVVVFSFVAVAAELVQITLFLAIGRLPALAYANSPSIRFGSVLDDPNGFAVLLALLIPTTWITLRSRPSLRLALTIALLCCLPLSQSWTGLTACVIALGATYLLTRGLRRDLRRAAAVVTSIVIVVGVAAFFARSTIAELIRLKRGSAEDHAASFAQVAPQIPSASPTAAASSSASAAVTAPEPGPAAHATWTAGLESSYVNILVNYGPALLVAYIALGAIAIVLLLRGRSRMPLALRAGGASYLICFMLASANLGLDRTFPCNVLYFLVCGLTFASVASGRRPAARADDVLERGAAT